MQTKYIERSSNMSPSEKRGFDSTSGEEGQPTRKRPALSSVMFEALRVDALQKLCSSFEPIMRRVVSEEVERAFAKLAPALLSGGLSPKRIEGTDGRNLQLLFRSKLSLPLFTGGKVEGEHGAVIHIVLVDANAGHIVTSGPESLVKLDVVVLEGDFNNEDNDNWTREEFDSHIVKEREGKRPLLTGDLQVTLKGGIGTLGELTFTDNSSWIRSRKFRLGLKVASGYSEAVRIREAKTDAFTVKDHRGELYKKHYPPALNDEVWRLEKIGKDGSFHKRLNKAGIYTVEDFLRFEVRDAQRLRHILGSGMSNKMWDVLIDHAKTCAMSEKLYVYYPGDERNVAVVFNNIYEFSGLIVNGQYHSADSLSDSQKVFVDSLVKQAYENWAHVVEYDGNSFTKQNGSNIVSNVDVPTGQQNFSNSCGHQIVVPTDSVEINLEHPAMDPNSAVGGYDYSLGFPRQPQKENLNMPFQYDASSIPPQNPLISTLGQAQYTRSDNLLALGQPQLCTSGFQHIGTSNLTSYEAPEDLLPEADIGMRSNEMLENEDMQHLLHIFNARGQEITPNVAEDGYPYCSNYLPAQSPNYSFGDDPSRSSGKAVIGWLKLKAALRWGIFVRKKAAERRAQLVELDDS
ncbi:hypothetical protein K2173_004344 [Erythroxylum novogranatense]|uniref:Calmodulin-binding protein n=1 Tax=Erythroxylum novogranatense TaxID=1862640 RepID=A0AAV8T5R2_9ROSI|nr:hypothetical protein K2173_004344 [Erythroxylum novogranatense]